MKMKFVNICFCFLLLPLLGIVETRAQENKDSLVNVAFGKIAQEDLNNATSAVSISDLMKKNYSTDALSGLQSLVGGYNGNTWGQAPLILVDGVPRNVGNLTASEIESVTFLKDASAVVLYGSRAARGALLITTKRGKIQEGMTIDVRANSGVFVPKSYPKYLDADCYMSLYNEASLNDGLTPRYDAATIYHTASGTNPYRYPNIDFYSSEYLKKAYYRSDVTGEVYGGNERTQYYMNFGMAYNDGLIKYGERQNDNFTRTNVRGNVDMKLTDWLKASTSTAVVLTNDYQGRGNFWGTASTLRPNWFSPLIPIDQFDPLVSSMQNYVESSNHIIDGKYLLGGTSTDLTNAFADMLAAGYVKEKSRRFMFDVSATADLNRILEGLSFKTAFSMDYSAHYSEAWREQYAVYQPTWSNVNGKDGITSLVKYNNDEKATQEYVGTSRYDQTMLASTQFDYVKQWADHHNLSATLLGWAYQTQNTADENHDGSAYHKISNANLGLRAAYNYDRTYYIDFSSAYVHSAKLPEGKRGAFSPTVSVGWRISNEEFFNDNQMFVDNLKLTTSFSKLHQDLDISDYYMYKGYFNNQGGWFQWRDGSGGGNTTGSVRGDNPELSFIQRQEFRVGLDASLLNGLLSLNTHFFVQKIRGLLTQGASTVYPSYFNLNENNSFLPWLNYNNDKRTGIDFSVSANKKFGDWDVTMGVVGMYMATEASRRDEVHGYDYLYRGGRPIDASFGYVYEGFFQDQEDIDNSPRQTFGTVRPGDLKYKDINGDGVIDTNDQIDLGTSGSPFYYGMNLTLKWKNFTLFAMGTGESGGIGYKNSSYYWNRGTSKFSDVVWERWAYYTDPNTGEVVDTRATATYPRLTTTNGDNNYRNSTFWMYKRTRFNLNRIQLTYDLPQSIFVKTPFIKGLSVYCSGDNLLVISKERELMETNIGAAPQTRFYNLGFKVAF